MQEFTVAIPNGRSLIARGYEKDEYPCVQIFLKNADGTEDLICFAEHNPEHRPGFQVCVGVYVPTQEDTVYYEPYETSEVNENE